jgi:hypothetical protein
MMMHLEPIGKREVERVEEGGFRKTQAKRSQMTLCSFQRSIALFRNRFGY